MPGWSQLFATCKCHMTSEMWTSRAVSPHLLGVNYNLPVDSPWGDVERSETIWGTMNIRKLTHCIGKQTGWSLTDRNDNPPSCT